MSGHLTIDIDLTQLWNKFLLRNSKHEASILKLFRKTNEKELEEILEQFFLSKLISKPKIREDLFFFLLIIYLEKPEPWRLEQINKLLDQPKFHLQKNELKFFLDQLLKSLRSEAPADLAEKESAEVYSLKSTGKIDPTKIGVLLDSKTSGITSLHGTNISQTAFRVFRTELIFTLATDLLPEVQDTSTGPFTIQRIEKLYRDIAKMRHFLAIVQSGSVYSKSSQAFRTRKIPLLLTPITATELYEPYWKEAQSHGNSVSSIIQHEGVRLVSYGENKSGIFWLHAHNRDRSKILGFALSHLNKILTHYRTGLNYEDSEAFLRTFAPVHYFLCSTLPSDRGGSYATEVLLNVFTLLFSRKLLSWKGKLPDCLAFCCPTLEEYQSLYPKITDIHDAESFTFQQKLRRPSDSATPSAKRTIDYSSEFDEFDFTIEELLQPYTLPLEMSETDHTTSLKTNPEMGRPIPRAKKDCKKRKGIGISKTERPKTKICKKQKVEKHGTPSVLKKNHLTLSKEFREIWGKNKPNLDRTQAYVRDILINHPSRWEIEDSVLTFKMPPGSSFGIKKSDPTHFSKRTHSVLEAFIRSPSISDDLCALNISIKIQSFVAENYSQMKIKNLTLENFDQVWKILFKLPLQNPTQNEAIIALRDQLKQKLFKSSILDTAQGKPPEAALLESEEVDYARAAREAEPMEDSEIPSFDTPSTQETITTVLPILPSNEEDHDLDLGQQVLTLFNKGLLKIKTAHQLTNSLFGILYYKCGMEFFYFPVNFATSEAKKCLIGSHELLTKIKEAIISLLTASNAPDEIKKIQTLLVQFFKATTKEDKTFFKEELKLICNQHSEIKLLFIGYLNAFYLSDEGACFNLPKQLQNKLSKNRFELPTHLQNFLSRILTPALQKSPLIRLEALEESTRKSMRSKTRPVSIHMTDFRLPAPAFFSSNKHSDTIHHRDARSIPSLLELLNSPPIDNDVFLTSSPAGWIGSDSSLPSPPIFDDEPMSLLEKKRSQEAEGSFVFMTLEKPSALPESAYPRNEWV